MRVVFVWNPDKDDNLEYYAKKALGRDNLPVLHWPQERSEIPNKGRKLQFNFSSFCANKVATFCVASVRESVYEGYVVVSISLVGVSDNCQHHEALYYFRNAWFLGAEVSDWLKGETDELPVKAKEAEQPHVMSGESQEASQN